MKATSKRHRRALIIIDCVNDLEFKGGEKVLPWARRMVPRLRAVRALFHRKGLPVIYANDNFERWQADIFEIVSYCSRRGARGAEVTKALKPMKKDYYIIKPRHSAFYATSLDPLLEYLRVNELILAGMATNLCVLFTAHDAHMRGYSLTVLSDCCAAESDHDHDVSLEQLKRFCRAKICLGKDLFKE